MARADGDFSARQFRRAAMSRARLACVAIGTKEGNSAAARAAARYRLIRASEKPAA
jgi:hypothetical protein